jgi:hypothetical protein
VAGSGGVNDIADFLERQEMMRVLPRVALTVLAYTCREWSTGRGAVIVAAGEKADALHFIREGQCRVRRAPGHRAAAVRQ